ncbi:lycopene cyclase domain-containing protein [Faecalibacter bovis]|uniref:lycopene cyclase domain-containing protein n=1 Tax=Faecalibacter bovis TaxID=2898187 RepID=UPI001E30B773|nr:lycopene cyclase domain-containing protein [Faecalibacter bovis]
MNFDKTYTLVTAILTTLTIIYLHLITRTPWIGQASLIYSILMLGFFPVNGILTGTGLENPIVNYNPNEFLNFRIGTIPIEDAVYGYSLFLWNIYFFKFFKNKMK